MRAMVFAAGIGSRMGELTRGKPKSLVEVAGVPLLQRVLERLKKAGVTDVAINLHHYPEQIRSFLGSQDHFGLSIKFSYEEQLLDTGGGLHNVRDFFDGTE